MNTIPDGKKSPAKFVDFLQTTIWVFHADSRDLWVLVQHVLSPAVHARFLAHLGHDVLANLIAENTAREAAILATVTAILQKSIDIANILDTRPRREGADEFLERFSEMYIDQSGDVNFRNGVNPHQ